MIINIIMDDRSIGLDFLYDFIYMNWNILLLLAIERADAELPDYGEDLGLVVIVLLDGILG